MATFKLTLAYDGTDYIGWQRQATGVSIQGVPIAWFGQGERLAAIKSDASAVVIFTRNDRTWTATPLVAAGKSFVSLRMIRGRSQNGPITPQRPKAATDSVVMDRTTDGGTVAGAANPAAPSSAAPATCQRRSPVGFRPGADEDHAHGPNDVRQGRDERDDARR